MKIKCCPKCEMDLTGTPIPESYQHLYGGTHYSLKVGIYDIHQDRTVAWMCPFCGHRWPREEDED